MSASALALGSAGSRSGLDRAPRARAVRRRGAEAIGLGLAERVRRGRPRARVRTICGIDVFDALSGSTERRAAWPRVPVLIPRNYWRRLGMLADGAADGRRGAPAGCGAASAAPRRGPAALCRPLDPRHARRLTQSPCWWPGGATGRGDARRRRARGATGARSRARSRWSRTPTARLRGRPRPLPGDGPAYDDRRHGPARRRQVSLIGALVRHVRAQARPSASSRSTRRARSRRARCSATASGWPTTSSTPEVFIRSMGTRGHLGGLAEATLQAVLVLDAAGKDRSSSRRSGPARARSR